jgi:hypothetical protein
MATVEENNCNEIDVISHGGRKKGFLYINELKDDYPIEKNAFST